MKSLSDNKDVFQIIAPQYRKEDEHWGANLDKVISLLRNVDKRRPVWVDAGCGPGHHIQRVLDNDSLKKSAEVIGIDYSPKMLEEARKNVGKYSNVTLKQGNITEIGVLPDADIITCLNNTFGNLLKGGEGKIARKKFLKHAKKSLNSNGYLFLSVYNLVEIGDTYGKNLTLLKEDYEQGEFIVEYNNSSGTVKYYSHWFTEEELYDLLDRESFEVLNIEKDNVRLIITATK